MIDLNRILRVSNAIPERKLIYYWSVANAMIDVYLIHRYFYM